MTRLVASGEDGHGPERGGKSQLRLIPTNREVTMQRNDSALPALSGFGDDDPFLHRFLPGPSAGMRRLRGLVHHVNKEENRELIRFILLTGESGAGKYRVAQIIAGHARWNGGGFNPDEPKPSAELTELRAPIEAYTTKMGEVLLLALPESLAEAELFGNVAGAFTGALRPKPGYFADPAYDHVLLDEIGDASLPIQGKLLAVLDGRPFVPVGGTAKDRRVCDKRILMATLRDLKAAVAAKTFREDLYRRLTRLIIPIPPLREMPESIPKIANEIVRERCPQKLRTRNLNLSDRDLEWARKQPWPGNIRELRDVIEDWLAGAGRDPLDVVASRRAQDAATVAEEAGVSVAVRAAIEEVLSGKRPSAGTVSGFVDEFTAPVKALVESELRAWYGQARPDQDVCLRLFPRMKWESIKSTMSKLGGR